MRSTQNLYATSPFLFSNEIKTKAIFLDFFLSSLFFYLLARNVTKTRISTLHPTFMTEDAAFSKISWNVCFC